MKVSEWAFDRIKEAFEKVAKMRQKAEHRPRNHVKKHRLGEGRGHGGVTMSCLCPHCNSFPMEDNMWWASGGKGRNNWWRLWRNIQLEATTKQAFGGADKRKS